MDVVKTLAPGKPGTKRFVREWGDALVAVRYRKNESCREMLTTIEVIVDRRSHQPGINQNAFLSYRKQQIVAIFIDYNESQQRLKAKKLGARWSAQLKLWLLKYDDVVSLGFVNRIVHGAVEKCTDVDISLL